jgi:peptidoglycan/LPS O-acetylase OafA/YrhL
MLAVMLFNDDIGNSFIPRQEINITGLKYIDDFKIPRVIFWGLPCIYFVVNFINYFEHKKVKELKYLGDVSYSIYMVHSALFLAMGWVLKRYSMNYYAKAFVYIIAILLIIPLSHLTSVYIEKSSGSRNPFSTMVGILSFYISLVGW